MARTRLFFSAYAAFTFGALAGCGGGGEDTAPIEEDAAFEIGTIDTSVDTGEATDSALEDSTIDAEETTVPSDAADTSVADTGVAETSDTSVAETSTTDTGVADTAMCATGSDCPGADGECATRTCTGGVCGFSFAADGTALAAQTAGDCKKAVCNGAGGTKNINDDLDLPVDANGCTNDVCTGGVPSHSFKASGTPCSDGTGKVCTASGACVACVVDGDCTAPNTCNMTTHACVGPASCTDGMKNGTETDVDCGGSCPKVCKVGKACMSGADCESGFCALATCQGPSVKSTIPLNGVKIYATTQPIVVTFQGPMDGATLTANSVPGPCTGAVQVSSDDFVTCAALGSLTMSAGNTVASFAPVPSFSFGTKYKLRVTTAAKDGYGNALVTAWNSNFDTLGAALCTTPNNTVVISQVYAGGLTTGAAYKRDFVELHNRGMTSVDVTGWSVQVGPALGGPATDKVNLTGSIPAGGYLLVGGTAGTDGAHPLADITGTMSISDASARIELFATTTLTTSCSGHVDEVGYGTAVCFEGSTAPTPAGGSALFRRDGGGCSDGDNNFADFYLAPAAPRRSSTPPSICETCVTRNETVLPEEADYCAIQPSGTAFDITTTASVATREIYTQLYEAGTTETPGAPAGVIAQIGYGPASVNPSTQSGFTWTTAAYNLQVGNNDEYHATLTIPTAGSYRYATRFSLDGGTHWTYCDKNGAGSNASFSFETSQLPTLTVSP